MIEEVMAVYDEKTLYHVYRMAMADPFSCAHIKITIRNKQVWLIGYVIARKHIVDCIMRRLLLSIYKERPITTRSTFQLILRYYQMGTTNSGQPVHYICAVFEHESKPQRRICISSRHNKECMVIGGCTCRLETMSCRKTYCVTQEHEQLTINCQYNTITRCSDTTRHGQANERDT